MSERPKLPQARVRRSLDVGPLPAPPSQLKVRPFVECFDRGGGLSALILRGEIRDDRFEINISDAATLSLAAASGQDGHGPFVCLLAQEHAVGEHHALRIDADAHDSESSLAAISYFELTADLVARRELAYASRWYSVYFNALGLVDGQGSGGPRSVFPARLPS
jgi:hypothetical protein